MNRLTKKLENDFYKLKDENIIYGEENGIRLVQIVGQLEDIEEELGIDLLTLFKAAFIDGIYYIDEDYGIVKNEHELAIFCDCLWENNTNRYYFYKAYGKTWTLTKKELMKSKFYKMYKEGKKTYE